MSVDEREETVADGPIGLYDEATGELLMEITPEQLRRIQDALEEEFPEDHDYFVNLAVLDYMFNRAVDAEILDRLREVMGTREGIDMLWSVCGERGTPDATERGCAVLVEGDQEGTLS